MRPRDWEQGDGADTPTRVAEARAYLLALREWDRTRRELTESQQRHRAQLDAAQDRLDMLLSWLPVLEQQVAVAVPRRDAYDATSAQLASNAAALEVVDGEITDLAEAQAVGTARLLGETPLVAPLVLLPLRLEVRWSDDELKVRIFPDQFSIDSHTRTLSALEAEAGGHYWTHHGEEASAQQAWDLLVRQFGAPRAAWVAKATEPSRPAPDVAPADAGWTTSATARLIPDRFAAVLLREGVPLGVGLEGNARRYISWGSAVTTDLSFDPLTEPGEATWVNDFDTAQAQGLALRIPLPTAEAEVDTLLVFGLRTAEAAGLNTVLRAHAYTDGLAVLADGVPTNNSGRVRAGYTPARTSAAARALLLDSSTPGTGSAGAELSEILGVDPTTFSGVIGGSDTWPMVQRAVALVVGTGVTGALAEDLGAAGTSAWPVVSMAGQAPTIRVGHQPYGVLAATAPGRWTPRAQETGQELTSYLRWWARATGPALLSDPVGPGGRPGGGSARHATQGDDAFEDLLLEMPHSVAWSNAEHSFRGLDQVLGPTEGSTSPAAYLEQVAAADPTQLQGIAAEQPSLLARVALGAKSAVDSTRQSELDTALRTVAAAAADAMSRKRLAALLCSNLDALSHRLDPWVTGVASERLHALRREHDDGRVGGYGVLTDLRPATGVRTDGHIHAPSLAHASTAAVLRSAYRSQSGGKSAPAAATPLAVDLSSARVRSAQQLLAAVRRDQPIAFVLGSAFEEDLARAGQQQYLASFRKLTRFRTGTALEALEEDRRQKVDALVDAQAKREELQQTADDLRRKAEASAEALAAAQQHQAAAEAAAAPYRGWEARLAALPGTIDQLVQELAAIDRRRPRITVRREKITVPDLP